MRVCVRKSELCSGWGDCRVTGRAQGLTPEGSSTALLNPDDVSAGPSEDEESTLLPGGGQSRVSNSGLDSIFERMESQQVEDQESVVTPA